MPLQIAQPFQRRWPPPNSRFTQHIWQELTLSPVPCEPVTRGHVMETFLGVALIIVGLAQAGAVEPAADGTQSVVVPADRPPPATEPSVLVPQPPTTNPPTQPPVEPPAAPPAAGLATDLLAQALEPLVGRPGAANGTAALYARPLPLLEALDRSGDRARRLWIAQAYWKVAMELVERS